MKERLQKILARGGYGSRRSAEALITSGRVCLNGEVVTVLGTTADPDADHITVDGRRFNLHHEPVYLAMHKPAGFVTTVRDPQGRRTVMELLPKDLPPHVLPVGRLDLNTEGLLLFTNDGELAHRLAHPRYELDKEYHALVGGRPSANTIATLLRGVDIGHTVVSATEAGFASAPPGHQTREGAAWIRIVIHEGRKRQVRLMCAKLGHPVRELVRTRIGVVRLGRLQMGEVRELAQRDLSALLRAVGLRAGKSQPLHSRR